MALPKNRDGREFEKFEEVAGAPAIRVTNVGASATTDLTVTNATGASTLAATTALAAEFKLIQITIKFSAAPTTSENLTITLNANDGSAYDTILLSTDPSVTSATDIVFELDGYSDFEAGDEIKVDFANTDTVTYGVRIVTRAV